MKRTGENFNSGRKLRDTVNPKGKQVYALEKEGKGEDIQGNNKVFGFPANLDKVVPGNKEKAIFRGKRANDLNLKY